MLLSKINRKWNNSYGKTHNEDLDKCGSIYLKHNLGKQRQEIN